MEAITRVIAGREFWRVGELVIRRDASGRIEECTHALPASVRANPFAEGPFCRFALAAAPSAEGVYAVAIEDRIVYIGECVSLSKRFGATGYGAISPRNCHHDGQSTNCKVNSRVLSAAKEGAVAVVWFFPTNDRRQIEAELIGELRPPWNGSSSQVASRPAATRTTQRSVAPSNGAAAGSLTDVFRATLRELWQSAQNAGYRSVQVRAGDLHRNVGGYPGPSHRMPMCCRVMREAMSSGDRVLHEPPKGNGANFVVEYHLPRGQQCPQSVAPAG